MNPAGLSLLNAVESSEVVGRTVYDFLNIDYRAAYHALTEEGIFRQAMLYGV